MAARGQAGFATALMFALVLVRGLVLGQGAPAGVPPAMHGAPGGTATASPITQPMTLTDAKLRGFFDAMDAFKVLGKSDAVQVPADPSRPEAFAESWKMSSETQPILEKNGFSDTVEFQRVGYNAAMAYGVLQQGGKEVVRKKMEAARPQAARAMEKLKGQVSPEQLKVMTARMDTAMATGEGMLNVPDENLALMEKYRDRMAKLSK